MTREQKKISGFTLIEIMVTFVIMSFIVWSIYAIFNMADKTWNFDMGIVDLQQDARQAMDKMVKEIRQTRSSIVIITGGTQISFQVPIDITTSPVTYSTPISYYLESNQIIREYPVNEKAVLANNIDNLNFTRTGDIVEIELTATKTVRGRTLCFPSPCQNPKNTLLEKVMTRNE